MYKIECFVINFISCTGKDQFFVKCISEVKTSKKFKTSHCYSLIIEFKNTRTDQTKIIVLKISKDTVIISNRA